MLDPDLPLAQLEDAYRAWRETKGGNVDQVLALFDDRIEMHSILEPEVRHEIARVQRSREEAKSYFQALLDEWEMIDFPQEKIVADGDTVVWIGRCHWRSKRDGKEVDTPKVDIWTFRNGKAVRLMEMFDSLGFVRAAGLI